jgi:8-oxo-dGTP diphosphatase
MTQRYVVGLMFDNLACDHVALIEKTHPKWQAGLLNGIGGKVEDKESPLHAMVREFEEETGVVVRAAHWSLVAVLNGDGYQVHTFTCLGDVRALKTTTDERVVVFGAGSITTENAIPNLTYLLPMSKIALGNRAPFANGFRPFWVQE